MKLKLAGDAHEFEVELLERNGTAVRARIDGAPFEAERVPGPGQFCGLRDGPVRALAARIRDTLMVAVGPAHFSFTTAESGARRRARGLSAHEVVAPMPGKVLRVLVKEGDTVETG